MLGQNLDATLYEVPFEQSWRYFASSPDYSEYDIVASRWTDARTSPRREHAVAPADRYVLSLALRSTKLRLARGPVTLVEGNMAAGTLHVTGPGQMLQAEFLEACDFVHFYVAAAYVAGRAEALGAPAEGLSDLCFCDPLAAQLGRTLVDGSIAGDRLYFDSVGQTIVTRLLTARPPAPAVSPLPKWRLRRVKEYIEASIAERITLGDLASVAGLSRMHFAAQFRAATGRRPHDYLLQQRVEFAKTAMAGDGTPLAEVALCAGFQTQSHFSTVFKRVTGETPGQWRRANSGSGPDRGKAAVFGLTSMAQAAQHRPVASVSRPFV